MAAPHAGRDRLEALLVAIEALYGAAELRERTQRAALEALSLMHASAAVVYLEGPDAEPELAVSGEVDGSACLALARSVQELVRTGASAPHVGRGDAEAAVAPFRAEALRGAVLAKQDGTPFDETGRRVLAAFARQLGSAVAAVSLKHRLGKAERVQAVLLETLSQGAAAIIDGRLMLLNGAGAQLLGVDRGSVTGRPVEEVWPELAELLARGEPLDEEPLRLGGRDLLLTVRPISEGCPRRDAVVLFTERPAQGRLRRPPGANPLAGFGDVIGGSAALVAVRQLAGVAAQSSSNLVIEGESGAGKEILAQAIHTAGPRRKGPFVAVDCAAIPRELLESELFGYEAGAFTGASPHGHPGKFELAQSGTLLLDDVVEMPLEMQAKLLRVVQERAVTRLGGSRGLSVDVRIVATTNRLLPDAVGAGRFRSDLFYRLNVLRIMIPPLRDRREDIAPLAEHFLRKYSPAHGRRLRTVGPQALRALESYSWPGNVRELEHWIENEIHFAPPDATCLDRLTRDPTAVEQQRTPAVRPIREVERELYGAAITAAAGDVSRAARELGISRGKLYRKLRLYGLSRR